MRTLFACSLTGNLEEKKELMGGVIQGNGEKPLSKLFSKTPSPKSLMPLSCVEFYLVLEYSYDASSRDEKKSLDPLSLYLFNPIIELSPRPAFPQMSSV